VAVSNLPEDEVKKKKVEFGKKYEDVSKLIKEYDDLYNNCCLAYARTCSGSWISEFTGLIPETMK